MGLVKSVKFSLKSIFADQWREFYYCDAIPADVLVVKGQKRVNRNRNSNTKGSVGVISNGSSIAVNEGQCMIIVDQGAIVDVCADPGEFIYDNSSEPSIFYGDLSENIKNSIQTAARRFTFGGEPAKDQAIYYFNTREIMNNSYLASAIPFHLKDSNTGLELETRVTCQGMFTFRMMDPVLFYRNVCGNVAATYWKTDLVRAMTEELELALQPAMAEIAARGVLPSKLTAHVKDIAELVKKELTVQWAETRGLELVHLTLSPNFPMEDLQKINQWEETGMLRDEEMKGARKAEAASNMMEGMGGNGANPINGVVGIQAAGMMEQMISEEWTCECGTLNKRKFCVNCGKPRK